jgi:hypothetical protein
MRRIVALVLVTAALGLAMPSAAGAVIVVNKGMAGVKLGMTYPQARAKLGTPTRVFLTTNLFLGGRVRVVRFRLAEITLPLVLAPRVLMISTTGRTERTVGGVGVGSTQAMLQRQLPSARCTVELAIRHCLIGVAKAGHVITDFQLSTAKLVTKALVVRLPVARPPALKPPA